MSTLEDFENASLGSTAKKEVGLVVIRQGDETDQYPWICTTYGEWLSHEELVKRGYTLERPVPKNSHEALNLAWELAHPLKVGQVVPKGAQVMRLVDGEVRVYRADWDLDDIPPVEFPYIRTRDPLPDPEPDWLDAPAVLASMDDCSWQKVWFPKSDGLWECTCCGVERHWSKMSDVTPLYPRKTS